MKNDNGAALRPLIVYVPGLLPKPEASEHRDALLRCLLQGIRRIDATVADEIAASPDNFDLIAWTFDFYGESRDFAFDAPSVEAVLAQEGITPADVADATTWQRRLIRWLYTVGDKLPFLIPHLAVGRVKLHLRDLRRYLLDDNGIAEHARQMLKIRLRVATKANRSVLLIAHSMGSVIAYDSLWQMSHETRDRVRIDRLLTMGSPLGQTYMQQRLHGFSKSGVDRYPTNIRRWTNLAAIGDLTAIDPKLGNDFREMVQLDLVEELLDLEVRNYFRLDGVINTHAEYGYLINEVTARVVVDWWREQQHQPTD